MKYIYILNHVINSIYFLYRINGIIYMFFLNICIFYHIKLELITLYKTKKLTLASQIFLYSIYLFSVYLLYN